MLTHPTTIERENTLVNALLYKYGENLSDINGAFRRGILHRLDRNTSGLLVLAKTKESEKILIEAFKKRQIDKFYKNFIQSTCFTLGKFFGITFHTV